MKKRPLDRGVSSARQEGKENSSSATGNLASYCSSGFWEDLQRDKSKLTTNQKEKSLG